MVIQKVIWLSEHFSESNFKFIHETLQICNMICWYRGILCNVQIKLNRPVFLKHLLFLCWKLSKSFPGVLLKCSICFHSLQWPSSLMAFPNFLLLSNCNTVVTIEPSFMPPPWLFSACGTTTLLSTSVRWTFSDSASEWSCGAWLCTWLTVLVCYKCQNSILLCGRIPHLLDVPTDVYTCSLPDPFPPVLSVLISWTTYLTCFHLYLCKVHHISLHDFIIVSNILLIQLLYYTGVHFYKSLYPIT